MSTKKLVMLALLAGAVFGLYTAGAPAVRQKQPSGVPGVKATLLTTPGRLGHGLGVVGAKIVAPAVRKTVYSTERELVLLRQDLRIASPAFTRTIKARAGADRVAALDSTAIADLKLGRPVAAFRDAMQANALVTAVHGNLRAD